MAKQDYPYYVYEHYYEENGQVKENIQVLVKIMDSSVKIIHMTLN